MRGRPETCLYSSHPVHATATNILSKTSVHSQNTKRPAAPNTLYKLTTATAKAYQSNCKPKTGTAINSATPSTPATSAFLPTAPLPLGADDDAPGALAVALSLPPVDEVSDAVVVIDAVVPVGRLILPLSPGMLLEMGEGRSPETLLEVGRIPVGVGVASGATAAQ